MFSIFLFIVISYEARVLIKIVVVVSFIPRGVLKMYLKRTLLNSFFDLFQFHIREIYSFYMHGFVLFILTGHLCESGNK